MGSAGGTMDAREALARLREGNEAFVDAHVNGGDISPERVRHLFEEGQSPFACVVACADSRVVPEHIFMTGLGELFCIRVAGNVVGDMELASCLYAAEHLHVPVIMVLGHTHCGAIESTIEVLEGAAGEGAAGEDGASRTPDAREDGAATESHAESDALTPLVSCIAQAIGDERNPYAASVANVQAALDVLKADPAIAHLAAESGLVVCGAVYHTNSGVVDFL